MYLDFSQIQKTLKFFSFYFPAPGNWDILHPTREILWWYGITWHHHPQYLQEKESLRKSSTSQLAVAGDSASLEIEVTEEKNQCRHLIITCFHQLNNQYPPFQYCSKNLNCQVTTSRAGHQARDKNWWLFLFNNNKTTLSSIRESGAVASTQLLFLIPVFYTLSPWLQLFYQPRAAVQVVTQTHMCSSKATPRQEALLVFPAGDSHFPSTAFKIQLPVQPICEYILPVVNI